MTGKTRSCTTAFQGRRNDVTPRRPWKAVVLIFVATSPLAGFAQTIQFKDVTEEAGLKQPLLGIMGHGGAWGDVDGDGRIDLYVGGFADRPNAEYEPAAGPMPNVLLKNLGDGRFERWKQPAVEFYSRTSGAVFADLDNDGDLELYSANNCKGKTGNKEDPQRTAQLTFSKLFRNDDGKLVDITEQSGACPQSLRTARNIGVLDYNGDGLLDLFICEDKFIKNPRSVLLKNLGDLKFKDASAEVGLPDDIFGLGLAVADINEDGRPDFFVGHSNRMFLSAKDGKYVESDALNKTFAWQPLDGEDWPCGAAFGDLNRDGRLDLVLSIHFEKARNRIFINEGLKNGVPQFRDVTAQAGLPAQLTNKSPHVEIQDFDNDGWPDIYFSTAWLDKDGSVTPLVYRNLGAKGGVPRFKPIREIKKRDNIVYYPAGPTGDYDGDGRRDIFLINWFRGNHSRLLHNESTQNNWLNVTVVGKSFNRQGIGSQVRVYEAGKVGDASALLGFQELTTGYGYASGQPAVSHFGLGDAEKVDIVARLPNGKQVKREGVPVNQTLTINEE